MTTKKEGLTECTVCHKKYKRIDTHIRMTGHMKTESVAKPRPEFIPPESGEPDKTEQGEPNKTEQGEQDKSEQGDDEINTCGNCGGEIEGAPNYCEKCGAHLIWQ